MDVEIISGLVVYIIVIWIISGELFISRKLGRLKNNIGPFAVGLFTVLLDAYIWVCKENLSGNANTQDIYRGIILLAVILIMKKINSKKI